MNWDAFILTALKILAVLSLVLLNGFFVAAEFALVRIRETQLDMLAAKGWRRAQMARHIVRHLNSYLSATQLGITMASLGLGWIGQPVFTTLLSPLLEMLGIESSAWLHSISFAIGFTALTFLHITVGELAPKWLTIQKPLPVALATAIPLRWFYLAFYPFNRLLNLAARQLLKQIGIEPDAVADRAQTEEELRLVLATAGNCPADPCPVEKPRSELQNWPPVVSRASSQLCRTGPPALHFGDGLSIVRRNRTRPIRSRAESSPPSSPPPGANRPPARRRSA